MIVDQREKEISIENRSDKKGHYFIFIVEEKQQYRGQEVINSLSYLQTGEGQEEIIDSTSIYKGFSHYKGNDDIS